jgi:membrane protein required for colicin V production
VHIFDIICGVLACVFILMGIYRGFVEEVIRLVAVVAAFFAGISLYRTVAGYIKFLHLSGSLLSVIAFLAIFLACVLAIVVLGMLIKKVVHLTVLGWVDRLCGGVLGFVKIFFLAWIIVMTISSLPFDGIKKWFKPSKAYAFFNEISPRLRAEGLMPSTGPVQNILRANPLPAIKGALQNVTAAADSVSVKMNRDKEKPRAGAAKPSTSSGVK